MEDTFKVPALETVVFPEYPELLPERLTVPEPVWARAPLPVIAPWKDEFVLPLIVKLFVERARVAAVLEPWRLLKV